MTEPSPTGAPPLPAGADVGTARAAIVRAIRRMGLLLGLLNIPLALAPLLLVAASDPAAHLPTWNLVVVQLVTLVAMQARPDSRRLLALVGVLNLVSFVWWMPLRLTPIGIDWWGPSFWALPWLSWAVSVWSRRTFGWVLGLVLASFTVGDPLSLWLAGHEVTAMRLAPLPWFTVPVAMVGLFGYGLLSLAEQADHQADRRRVARAGEEAERARGDARREAARLLHDHVLHALHALTRDPAQVPRQMVVDECREALEAVEQVDRTDPMVHVEQVIAEDPAARDPHVVVRGGARALPHAVATALAAATHESLTNAATHADAEHVVVTVGEHDSQWHVEIRDDGRGFDTGRTLARGHLGLRHSVAERLEDAGGLAQVTSRPGRGTTVHLAWPALDGASDAPDADGPLWPRMGDQLMRRTLATTAWPAMANTIFMAALCGAMVEPAWPLQLAAAGLFVLGMWWLWHLRTHPMTIPGQLVIFVVTTLAWWLNLWLVPDQATSPYALWIAWTAAGLVHLAVLQVPFWQGVTMLVSWTLVQAVSLVVAVGWQRAFAMNSSLTTGLIEGTVALATLRSARRLTDENAVHARVAEALRRSAARSQAETHVQQFWSKRVTEVALPLLRRVVEQPALVGTPAMTAQASRLEATLRDELVLGPGHETFLDALGALRQKGWSVRSTINTVQGRRELEHLGRLLGCLGAPSVEDQSLTLSASGGQAVALVLAPSHEQCERWARTAHEAGVRCDVDHEFVRLSADLTAPVSALAH